METMLLSSDIIRKRKFLILICGVFIYFLASMSKVIIPSTIFQDLQKTGMDVARISSLGSAFMYSYAASQLLIGCFSDRYGGVRILLIGGSLFTIGTVAFPLLNNFYLMILFRALTGFGAGTIFLGITKLVEDLYSKRFSFVLGVLLLLGYLGPTTGTVPMVKLVSFTGWRTAMLVPGLIAATALSGIVLFCRGTIKEVKRGQTFYPLTAMLKNKYMWILSVSCASVFGTYYVILSQTGQKTLVDSFAMSPDKASWYMMLITFIVAANNVGVNMLLKLFKDSRKKVLLLGIVFTLLGSGIAWYGFKHDAGLCYFLISVILIAFSAGYFPLFGTIAKELNPPELTGMSIAYINFVAFLFIALFQNITGNILKAFPTIPGSLAFSPAAYSAVYLFFILAATAGVISVFFLPETKPVEQQQ